MCVEYVETLVMRMVVLVLDCIVQYECQKIVNWKEVWCEGETVCYGELGVDGDGSYIPEFKTASKILLEKIICSSFGWLSDAASLWMHRIINLMINKKSFPIKSLALS